MRKLFKILIIALLPILGNAQQESSLGWMFINTNTIDADKQAHFVGGFIFAPVGYFLGLDLYDGDRSKAIWTGVAVGTGVGLVKEITDINKTGFNTNDLVWTMIGATASTWITDKIHYPNYVRNRKEKEKVAQLEAERVSRLTDEEKLIEVID